MHHHPYRCLRSSPSSFLPVALPLLSEAFSVRSLVAKCPPTTPENHEAPRAGDGDRERSGVGTLLNLDLVTVVGALFCGKSWDGKSPSKASI